MAEPTIVIGGGPTGLGAALHLDGDWLLFERDGRIGGTCQTDVIDGFAFDHAGHIVFTTDPYVQELIPDLLGDNIHWQTRESWVYSNDVFTRYPFQANTYGLPVEVIKECLLGLIDATYAPQDGPPPANFEEWIVRTFGHGIADHFMLPYNRKVWATPLTMMSYDWMSDRVMQPRIDQVLEGALRPGVKDWGPNARFGYPLRGGFQAYMDALMNRLDASRVQTGRRGHGDCAAAPHGHAGRRRRGRLRPAHLHAAPAGARPSARRRAGGGARRGGWLAEHDRDSACHGINRADIDREALDRLSQETVFHRIFVESNASPYNAPPGTSAYICEITTSQYKPLEREGLVERVVARSPARGHASARRRDHRQSGRRDSVWLRDLHTGPGAAGGRDSGIPADPGHPVGGPFWRVVLLQQRPRHPGRQARRRGCPGRQSPARDRAAVRRWARMAERPAGTRSGGQ